MNKPSVSVIIPAHNEEKYITRCISSIRKAAECYGGEVEIVVSANRCSDKTVEIARSLGAVVTENDYRCIAKVRNDGLYSASGDIIMTIDADNVMTEGSIQEAVSMLSTNKYIGGGAPIRFERRSFGIFLLDMLLRLGFVLTGLYCAIFWTYRETALAVGGFPEKKVAEDIAFARALKKYGRAQHKKYGHLRKNHLINSTRKFDKHGDFLYFRIIFKILKPIMKKEMSKEAAMDKVFDEMYYDYDNNE